VVGMRSGASGVARRQKREQKGNLGQRVAKPNQQMEFSGRAMMDARSASLPPSPGRNIFAKDDLHIDRQRGSVDGLTPRRFRQRVSRLPCFQSRILVNNGIHHAQ
jgi:hypothetical protein